MSTTAREKVDVPSRGAAKHQRLFEDLARRFYAGVYNYLCCISRDTALAEDLTQETFMQVWRYLPELRNERAARPWIYRVARNQFLQHQRRSGVETVALDDCGAVDLPDTTSPAPQVRLEQAELEGLSLQLLPSLHPRGRHRRRPRPALGQRRRPQQRRPGARQLVPARLR